jgi:hypothetical protein
MWSFKKMSVLSLCFLCEKNSWSSKLFSDPICPFSTCWVKSLQYIRKELTVQVTSKRSCVFSSSLALIEHMWDHMQAKLYHPPPLPPVSMSQDQGHQGSRGRGGGCCWSSPDSCAPMGFSHGSDPSDMTLTLSQLTDSPSSRRTPLSEYQSQRMFHPTTTELGGRRSGGTRERRFDSNSTVF